MKILCYQLIDCQIIISTKCYYGYAMSNCVIADVKFTKLHICRCNFEIIVISCVSNNSNILDSLSHLGINFASTDSICDN